jgi:beta-N-acetylhexosaminidase
MPHLIIDVPGLVLSATDRKRLQHPLVGGVILFGRNWADRAQLTALCRAIKRVRPDLLIMVDHEGGRVQRFRTDGFTHLPPMRVLGQMWHGDGKAPMRRSARCARPVPPPPVAMCWVPNCAPAVWT